MRLSVLFGRTTRQVLPGVVAAVAVCAGCNQDGPAPGIEANVSRSAAVRPGFTVIAHRGNSSEAPENTLAAINSAFALACPMVEVDITISRDGVPVVFHDSTVDRVTNGTGTVHEFTLLQLKALDAGTSKSPEYAGERIPTLAEALEAARGRGQLFLDLKLEGLAPAIAAVIHGLGLPDESVVIAPWTSTQVRDFKARLPGSQVILALESLPTGWDSGYFTDQLAQGVSGFDLGDVQNAALPDFIREAHARGMRVFAYTINDELQMRRLIDMGVDGLETDRPAALLGIVRELQTAP